MNHPMYTLHLITDQIESIKVDLLDVNDNKSKVLKTVKEIQENIIKLRDEYHKENTKKEWEQVGYFENVKIDYSVKDVETGDVISTFDRVYKDCSITMKMLKDIIYAERAIQNRCQQLLSAKVTILDLDEDFEDGEI
jgi:hypothetical protein